MTKYDKTFLDQLKDQLHTLSTLRQSMSHANYNLGREILDKTKIEMPSDLMPANMVTSPGIADTRLELIGAIVAGNPREYDDTPEAAVYQADYLLRLFNITSKAS